MKITHLSEDERNELIRLEKVIPHKGVATRIKIILALDLGYSVKQVSEILLLDEDTITKWKRKYRESRFLSDWLGNEYHGYQGKLDKDQEKIVEKFVEEEFVSDCQQVVEFVKNTFGIEYSIDGVTKLLKRLAFSYKLVVIIPGKSDPEKQVAFVEEYKKIEKETKPNDVILFSDGVHPTHNPTHMRCWVKKGQEKIIKTNTGRDRLNIIGGLNIQKMILTVGNYETINGDAIIKFFDKVQLEYDEAENIYIVVDNARYNHSKKVQEYLVNPTCRIRIKYLPTYSPNLNLIERLWKYMRQKVIGVKYREKFTEFEHDIMQFLENIDPYRKDLKTFIGNEFHIIGT